MGDVEDAVHYRFFVYCGRMIKQHTKSLIWIVMLYAALL